MTTNKYPECEYCQFNDDENGICDFCEDADQYEPYEEDTLEDLKTMTQEFREKEAA